MSQPLRVGLLTPTFVGATGVDSGIGTHFRHLADGLAEAGHSVTALVVSDKPMSDPGVGYDVRRILVSKPGLARVLGRINWQFHQWLSLRAALAAAARAVLETKVDLWETTSTGSLALRIVEAAHRTPVAVRVSTTAAQLRATNAGASHWVSRRIEAWEDRTVRNADRVLTHSARHRAAIAQQFGLPVDRIPIIPHGIPVPPAMDRPVREGRCSVLFVGRFEHRKGIDLLFGALPEFLAAVPGADVTLVGADANHHWQNRWNAESPAGLRERVRFAGVVDAPTLAAHYRTADLFVAPSRYESFGLMFVEAMARALPVIALDAPGAADLIESGATGLLVPPEDSRALAGALVALARDPERRQRIGRAARRVVEQRYSLSALTEASVSFYRSMLADAPR